MSQEYEAGEDQERRIKRRTYPADDAYDQGEREQLMEPTSKIRDKAATEISFLPIDVLFCIFDKLLELVDYVRFAAICKELRFVAKDYNHTKQRWWRSKQRRLLPMLMLPPTESLGIDNDSSRERQTKQRLLYSVSERRIYNNINLRLSVPYNERFCGSSHGWLASAHKSIEECQQKLKVQVIHEITLRNPFGKASEAIHLPPYMYRTYESDYHLTKEWIPKVILSADPALHPDNYYVLLAFYRPMPTSKSLGQNSPPLALIKGGQESWITIDRLIGDAPMFDDAIFYKNKFYLVLERGQFLVTVDVNSSNLSPPKEKYIRTRPGPSEIFPHVHCWERYLVESTNGDLLLVQRFYTRKGLGSTSFGVCKIVFNEECKFTAQLVEVKCIGDDALFLGQSQSVSVLASTIPGCQPNSIYYATEDVTRYERPIKFVVGRKSEMGIFNLGDRTRTPLLDSDSINNWNWNNMNMPLWILPSLKTLQSS